MKILFIHKQILFPRDSGGKIRVLNLLKELCKYNTITYLCNLRPGEEVYLPEMESLGLRVETTPHQTSRRGGLGFYRDLAMNLLSKEPFTVARNYDPALKARAEELVRSGGFDLAICDTVQMARHAIGLGVPVKILFQHNVEAQILERYAETGGGRLRPAYMRIQWRKMRRFEEESSRRFDAVIAVSEGDREKFLNDYGLPSVYKIDTSVDLDYFTPSRSEEVPGRVAFVGSMDWLPNDDAVQFFVQQAWPAVRAAVPGATFQVIGRNPPPHIRRLTGADGVEVVGSVPDVRPYLASAEVVIVPILVGGGTRLKIFEAMAMGKAVVSTTLGAEGLPIDHGRNILLADDPAEFATAVIDLLRDPIRRSSLAQSARDLVVERFGTEAIARQFDGICRQVLETAHSGGS